MTTPRDVPSGTAATDPAGEMTQIVVPTRQLREELARLLAIRGRYLFQIPQEEEGALPTYGIGIHLPGEKTPDRGTPGPLPTSARILREIARDRAREADSAERWAQYTRDRQEAAEEEARRAEHGIAPPGFYLVSGT